MQQVQAKGSQIVNGQSIGGKILLDLSLSVFSFMNHASSIMYQDINLLDLILKLRGCAPHRVKLSQLTQHQINIFIVGLLGDLLPSGLSSILVSADQVNIGPAVSSLLGRSVTDTTIGSSDDKVLSLECALKRRKGFRTLGEIEVTLDHELQFSQSVHLCSLTKYKQKR